MAAVQDPIVPVFVPEVFLPQDLDDVDNAILDSLDRDQSIPDVKMDLPDVHESVQDSLQDIPAHDTRDQSFSETVVFRKESDHEQEPEPIWNFPAAKLPTEDSDLNSPAAKLQDEDSDSQFIPVTKPLRKPHKPVENPPEHDFAIPKGQKKSGQRGGGGKKNNSGGKKNNSGGKKNNSGGKKSSNKSKPKSLIEKAVQAITPKSMQTRSSGRTPKNSSTKTSLGATSDNPKKSANPFAALSEKQDFRDAESG